MSPRDALRGWKSGGVPAEAGDAWRRWSCIGIWRWEPAAGVLHCCPNTVADGGAMTQLARPDLARNRPGRDHARPGPASASTEPVPADRTGLLRAGRPVPGWAVGTALRAPVALVGGWLIAGALQPPSYRPMRQTISVLAGHCRGCHRRQGQRPRLHLEGPRRSRRRVHNRWVLPQRCPGREPNEPDVRTPSGRRRRPRWFQ